MVKFSTDNKNKIEFISLVDSSFNHLLTTRYKNNKKIIIVDENTHEECLPFLIASFESLKDAEVILLPVGEENKVLETCFQVWEAFTKTHIQRNDLVINLGGGVVTDTGGFIASVYKRGIDFVNIPTTLLAMVDASVGGKTGVNIGIHKNQLGVFSKPVLTICDTSFLQTIDEQEIRAGKAEMLKHGLIASKSLFDQLNKENRLIPSNTLISEAIQIKVYIVDADFKEQGERKKLNFGHTVGHSLEGHLLEKNIRTTHGNCVAWGMLVESYLSVKLSGLSNDELHIIETKIRKDYERLPIGPSDFEQLIELMHHDKKNQGGLINFTLLESIGKAKIDYQLGDDKVLEGLKDVFI